METPIAETDWLVLRLDGTVRPAQSDAYLRLLAQLLATNSTYGLVGATDFVAVFQRGAATSNNLALAQRLKNSLHGFNAFHRTGHLIADDHTASGRAWYCAERERGGPLIFGRELDLPPGTYDITFRIRGRSRHPEAYALLDVIEDRGQTRAAHELTGDTGGYRDLTLRVRLTGAGDAEFRVFKIRRGEIAVDRIAWYRVE